MGWLKHMGWLGLLWMTAAAHAATASQPGTACPAASAASAALTSCIEKAAPTVARPAAAAPGVNQQVTLYCGATGPVPGVSASAPGDARAKGETECKKAADGGPTKVSVKLPKGIGIDFESHDTSLSYLFVVLAVLLIAGAMWLAARKATGDDGLGIAGLLLAGLVVFGLGGLLGYWWKDDRVTTLEARQVDKLVGNQDFGRELQRALLDNTQAAEERGQLKAKVAALEQDLAVARAKAADGGKAGVGDWIALLFGLLVGAMGVAWHWHQARIRNAQIEGGLRDAVQALEAEIPEDRETRPGHEAADRRRVHTALGILRSVLMMPAVR